MEPNILFIIIGAIALTSGLLLGKFVFAKNTSKLIQDAENQAKKVIADGQLQAENLKKEKLLEAKEKFVQLKSDYDRDLLQRSQKSNEAENRIKQKEQSITQKELNLDKQIKENDTIKENLNHQIEVVNVKRTELEKHQEEHIRRLEKVAGLTAEDARNQLIEGLKQEAHTRALVLQQEIIEDA